MGNQYANDFNRSTQTYYTELTKYKPLTKTKEKRLLKQIRRGNIKAKNELLEANLKFVFDIAKHYTGRGISISDLISEGNMGLIRAIDKFDETKDVKFISYAVWWIRQAMMEAIKKKKLLTMVEIDSNNSNDVIFDRNISDEEDETITRNDMSFSNGEEQSKKELINTQKEIIGKLLTTLNKREREIMECYYGLGNNEELTLLEIGQKFGLSSERIRQINKRSLRKLRSAMLLCNDMKELMK
jgi:RNA polymerase primary sigma factor